MSVSALFNQPGDSTSALAAGSVVEPEQHRVVLVCVFVATLVGLTIGVRIFWPYLVEEHRRISPWQWIPLWTGDLAAFFWFISAIVSPRIPSATAEHDRGDTENRKRRRRVFLVTMGMAIAIDLAHTAYAHWREVADFAAAEVVTGEVVANQVWEATDTTRYYVTVRFRDAMNRVHQEDVRVEKVHIGGLPMNIQAALTAGGVGFPIRVSYDPGLTVRSWLTDVGYDDGDRIYLLSYLVLLYQVMATLLFLVLLHACHQSGRDPWWESLYRPLPLIVTAVFLVTFAIPHMTLMRH